MVKDQNNLQWHGKYEEYYGNVLMWFCHLSPKIDCF